MKANTIILSTLAAVFLTASQAMAGGLLGDVIEGACGGCGAGKAADRVHKQLGRPLDTAGARAVDAYVPGLGTAWQVQDEMKRAAERNRNLRRQQQQQQPNIQFDGPGAWGDHGGWNGGHVQYGMYCETRVGRYGPGNVQPVGSACQAMTHYGPVAGYVSN